MKSQSHGRRARTHWNRPEAEAEAFSLENSVCLIAKGDNWWTTQKTMAEREQEYCAIENYFLSCILLALNLQSFLNKVLPTFPLIPSLHSPAPSLTIRIISLFSLSYWHLYFFLSLYLLLAPPPFLLSFCLLSKVYLPFETLLPQSVFTWQQQVMNRLTNYSKQHRHSLTR